MICCILIHLVTQPNIEQNIVRMKYLYTHHHFFEQTLLPFWICFFKILLDIFIQILNIIATYYQENELWKIMCYTSLLLISEIDTQYFSILQGKDLKLKFQDMNY